MGLYPLGPWWPRTPWPHRRLKRGRGLLAFGHDPQQQQGHAHLENKAHRKNGYRPELGCRGPARLPEILLLPLQERDGKEFLLCQEAENTVPEGYIEVWVQYI
jgi:hypothetical protein